MRSIRIWIAIVVLLLIGLGVVMIYSSSGVYARDELGDAGYFLKRHLIFLGIGFLSMISLMIIDYRILRKIAKPLMIFSGILLVLVLIPGIGTMTSGARRWIRFGGFGFQPSEFVKLTILIYAADYLARKKTEIKSFVYGFCPIMMVLGLVCLLIVKEPDLGNSVLTALVVFVLLFIAGARMRHLGSLGLVLVPAFVFLVYTAPYRMRRIVAFLDPWQDSQGAGFQLAQSQIALGSGGIWGVGLGKSVQKLFYLPAAHTDFILSIIGEELGILGTLSVVLLFFGFIWQGARIAKRTQDPFGYFLACGIVLMLGMQAMVNIGVSIGALPTKGLPLPFVSYGGSALIFNMMAVGLLLNISRTEDS